MISIGHYEGPVPLADGHKTYAKRIERTSKISGWFHPFSSALEWTEIVKICKNGRGKERMRVVCSGDVKRICVGNLADGSGIQLQMGEHE